MTTHAARAAAESVRSLRRAAVVAAADLRMLEHHVGDRHEDRDAMERLAREAGLCLDALREVNVDLPLRLASYLVRSQADWLLQAMEARP